MRNNSALTAGTRLFLALASILLTVVFVQIYFSHSDSATATAEVSDDKKKAEKQLDFSLTEADKTGAGEQQVSEPVKLARVDIEDLAREKVEELVRRLGALEAPKKQPFLLPEQSLVKPDLPGQRIKEKFPPDNNNLKKPVVDLKTEPLQVTRVSHTGAVDTLNQFTVTFSQPMVPVAAAEKEKNPGRFIKMSPQPEGSWRWLGTNTILFEPVGKRFPRGTVYKITVPSGTASVSGSTLKETKTWSVVTPAPSVKTFQPHNSSPQGTNPLMVAIFNQKIDRKSVLDHLTLKAAGLDTPVKVVDKSVLAGKYDIKSLEEEEWLAFRPQSPLPRDTRATVTFKKGFKSLEGPLLSSTDQQFQFSIYGPLELNNSPRDGVSPDDWNSRNFTFNNILDVNAFAPSMVKVSPAVKNMVPRISGNRIYFDQPLKPLTTYKVTFDRGLKDRFKQTLGKNKTVTFKTGLYRPRLNFDKRFITLPASRKAQCLLRVKGLNKVDYSVYKIDPKSDAELFNDYKHYSENQSYRRDKTWPASIKDKIAGRNSVVLEPDTKELSIDLAPYSKNGMGQYIIFARSYSKEDKREFKDSTWIQITDLAVDAFQSKSLVTLVTTLEEGKPVKGVRANILPRKRQGTTDETGLTKLPLTGSWEDSQLLVVERGGNKTILPATYGWRGGFNFNKLSDSLKWYGVTDRNLYKPGDEVKVKGWSRSLHFTETEKIELSQPQFRNLLYRITGSDGKEIGEGRVDVDQTGGFKLSFKIPEKVNLGRGNISFGLVDNNSDYLEKKRTAINQRAYFHAAYSIPFSIQEFRKPEFEMKVSSSKGTSMLFGESTVLTSKAQYFAGGSLKGSPVTWQVRASKSSYSPPGWKGFTFGEGNHLPYDYLRILPHPNSLGKTKTLKVDADQNGETSVKVKLDLLPVPAPVNCVCEATIQDVNRQTWTDKVNVLVHPADTYIGVKSKRWFYRVDEPVELKMVAVDLDGKTKAGKNISLKIQRKERDKNQKEKLIDVDTISYISKELPIDSVFEVKKPGTYLITTAVKDEEGRDNQTVLNLFIKDDQETSLKDVQSDKLILAADKEEYQPGDTAEIMVSSPIYPANGIINIRRRDIVETIPVSIKKATNTFKIPVKADYYPGFSVEVYLTGKEYGYGSETIKLKVPPKERILNLKAEAQETKVLPGGDTTINIELKDAKGAPIENGQVALAVVDEAVLALAGYKWGDPIDSFYPQSHPYLRNMFLRQSVILNKKIEEPPQDKEADDLAALPPPGALPPPPSPRQSMMAQSLGGMSAPRDKNMFQVEPTVLDERHYTSSRAEGAGRSAKPNIRIRANFEVLALFNPSIYTDSQGKASVKLHLPDSLTRYRVMAVAVSGDQQFGSSESTVTARMPLTIKPSAPRFLNFGDRCELPVVLQNQTDKPVSADVVLRAVNAIVGDKGRAAGKHLVIPANNRVEVRFPVSTDDKGKASFQCALVADQFTDASQFTLPVYVPASMESFATYGQVDKDAVGQKLVRPQDIYTEVGGLTISNSSTALQSLTDAFFKLRDYQFSCSEQLSSRVIAMVSLEDVLSAFGKMDVLEHSQYRAQIQKDVDELLTRQNSQGGFGLWKAEETRYYPYVSIQVAQSLSLARDNDYKVDDQKLSKARTYLKEIRSHIPKEYNERSKRSIEARALNVRYMLKDVDGKRAASLIKEALADRIKKMPSGAKKGLEDIPADFIKADLSLDCAGWLLPVLAKDTEYKKEKTVLENLISGSINETPSTASSNGRGYGIFNYCLFYSPRRTDAILMEALMETNPKNPLIPKMAKGLLAHRKNGSWSGTQENGYILQALNKYFNKYESITPDYRADTWLGDTLMASNKFQGRTTDTRVTTIPMESLAKVEGDTIIINKTGPGRLYYRIGLDYAPRNLNIKAADYGFKVTRTYEGVDDKKDVYKDKDGVWHFKAGALIKTKLSFETQGARYHMALADPLPAGTEPVNKALKGSRDITPGKGVDEGITPFWWWRRTWYEHQNLRDHQAEAFTSVLYSGKYDYEYMTRATTPGHYHVPPTKAEEMYSPETFGRTASEEVIVE